MSPSINCFPLAVCAALAFAGCSQASSSVSRGTLGEQSGSGGSLGEGGASATPMPMPTSTGIIDLPSAAGASASEAGASGDAGVCDSVTLSAENTPPRVVIVQDLSSSMKGQWQPLDDAMLSIIEQFGDRMALGFVPFSSVYLDNASAIAAMSSQEFASFFGAHDDDCDVSDASIIPPAVGNAALVKASYDAVVEDRMVGGTPTDLAIDKTRELLVDDNPNDGSLGYVVLLTDGQPNCSGSIADVTAKIQALADTGVATYVIGYNYNGSALGDWAVAGGTGDYFEASDTDSLQTQMASILDGVVACDYELSEPVQDPSYVRVSVDGIDRPLDYADNGWSLGSDGLTITLTGAACSDLQAPGDHALAIAVECEVVVVPPPPPPR